MCGIFGVWGLRAAQAFAAAEAACHTLSHRGPDDSGVWKDEGAGLALGHTRLSIQDLSPAGHQPMLSPCGRFVVVFNGEIYNHLELREQLSPARTDGESIQWRGHSDTETLLACFSMWGIEKTLKATVGMFAIALWDRQTRKLYLARDRLGEKPLYYGYVGGIFGFASELKALALVPGFEGEIDRGALALLMRHSCVPAPYCIYQGLAKLAPGTWLTLSSDQINRRERPTPQPYWSAWDAARAGLTDPLSFENDSEATDALEEVLARSVRGQMLADVPLGAFLSGGVDSSTIVALMQAQSSRPVKTFTIGFHEEGYNEAKHAKAVAQHLGTDHTELYVSPTEALAVIPKLPSLYDEPFSDSSQIPTYLVAQLTRRQVTVALSGDGGDELFGGYGRYFRATRWWDMISRFPKGFRCLSGAIIHKIPIAYWDRISSLLRPLAPEKPLLLEGNKLHKSADLLKIFDRANFYRSGFVSHWKGEELVPGSTEPQTLLTKYGNNFPTLFEDMMALDAVTYLPDDILVKVDRAAMSVSLETRVPLLDHRIFEFAWRLPFHYKIRHDQGKWLLRQVLYRHVPRNFIERPKMGFGVPIDSWLRGPLREWAEELLDEGRLKREGYFNPIAIRRKWEEHVSNHRNWQYHLWDVLMFQSWLKRDNSSQHK